MNWSNTELNFSEREKNKKEYKIHSVKYNLVMNILLKVSSVLFPLITFPYATRILGADSYGRVGFAISVVSYFALLASLGIPSYAVRKCAQVRSNENELNKTVKEILIINCIALFVTIMCFFGIVYVVPRFANEKRLLFICSISIILQTFGVEWFYQSIEQYDYITLRNISIKLISLIFLFFCVKKADDVVPYALITIAGTVGANFVNILRLPRMIDLRTNYQLNLKQHLKPIFILFFYYAATTIYTNLDIVMLGFMTNNSIVGYYNASVKIKTVLVSIIASIGAVALPRASYYLSNNMVKEFKRLISLSFNLVLFVSIPLAIYFGIQAKEVMLFLAGPSFSEAVLSMKWIMPSIIFIGIGSITAWQLLIPLGRDKCTLIGAIIGMIVDLIINYFLIPKFGAAGASIGTLCAEICVVVTHIIGLRDMIWDFFDMINFMKVLLSSLLGIPIILFINSYIHMQSNILICILTSFIYFGIFFITNFVLKEKSTKYIFQSLLRILQKEKKNEK